MAAPYWHHVPNKAAVVAPYWHNASTSNGAMSAPCTNVPVIKVVLTVPYLYYSLAACPCWIQCELCRHQSLHNRCLCCHQSLHHHWESRHLCRLHQNCNQLHYWIGCPFYFHRLYWSGGKRHRVHWQIATPRVLSLQPNLWLLQQMELVNVKW